MTRAESLRVAASFDPEFFRGSGSLFFARALSELYSSEFILLLRGEDGSFHALASVGEGFYLSLRGFVRLEDVLSGEAASQLGFSYVDVHHVPRAEFVGFATSLMGVPKKWFVKHKAVCREWLRNNIVSFSLASNTEVISFALSAVDTRNVNGNCKHLCLMQRVNKVWGSYRLGDFVHMYYSSELVKLTYTGFVHIPGWYYRK